MKKIIFSVLMFTAATVLYAQDLKEIKTYVTLRQYPKAKEAIDNFLSVEANTKKAEVWYYKAFVYNVLSRDAATGSIEGKKMIDESFAAIKKYTELDPKMPLTKDEENTTLYNLYYGYFDLGVKAYNSKNFADSYTDFTGALTIHDYIISNALPGPKEIKFSALDTDVVWNLVILGNELKKGDEVIPYYKKIVDADLKDPKFMEAYQAIVLHFKETKDQANFDLFLAKGKQHFPNEVFWEAVDIENATQGIEGIALFKKYDELTGKYPNSYVLFFNNAIELNKFINEESSKSLPDYEKYRSRIPDLLKKAISINATPEANMLLASYYYNYSFDLTEMAGKIKGTKPDDIKKRNDFTAAYKKAMDDCIPYAEAAADLFSKLPKLKATDKANYKQAYDMLMEIYRAKGDAKKMVEYKVKKDAIQ